MFDRKKIVVSSLAFFCVNAIAGDVRGKLKSLDMRGGSNTAEVVLEGAYSGDAPSCHKNNHLEKKFHLDISTESGRLNYDALKGAMESGRDVHVLSSGGCRDGKEKIALIIVM